MLLRLLLLAAVALLPAHALAQSGFWVWLSPASGNSNSPANWYNGSTNGLPTPGDEVQFFNGGTTTVNWFSPADSVYNVNAAAGRVRYNCTNRLGVRTYALVNSESLSVLSGSMGAAYWYVGYGANATLFANGSFTRLYSRDSTTADYFGWGGKGTVRIGGGARFSSNSWIQIASGAADICTTTVIGFNFLDGNYSTLRTLTRSGDVNRGDMVVGQAGNGTILANNGGIISVAGDLFLGANGGAFGNVHLFNTATGFGNPSLTVGGLTVVGADLGGAGGVGYLQVDKGSATLLGTCVVRHGLVNAQNPVQVSMPGGLLLGAQGTGSQQAGNVQFQDGAIGTIGTQLVIGAGVRGPGGLKNFLNVSFASSLDYNGPSNVKIEGNGSLSISGNSSFQSNAEVDVQGQLTVDGSCIAPVVKATTLGTESAVIGVDTGFLRAKVNIDAGSGCVCNNSAGEVFSIGDSTSNIGFVCQGAMAIYNGALRLLDKNGAELGDVYFSNGTLQLPQGGRIAPGTEIYSSNGRIEGDLVSEGAIYIYTGSSLNIAGRLTHPAGPMGLNGTLHVLPGGVFSARGAGPYKIALDGHLYLYGSPSKLAVSAGGVQAIAGSTMHFNLGSAPLGAADTLAVNGPVTLGGTLAIRTGPHYFPQLGEEFTIITANSITGTFSDVTVNGVANLSKPGDPNGVPAPAQVLVTYGPTSVKVKIVGAISGVTDAGASPTEPRLVAAGSLGRPRFALSVPEASRVLLVVYDVTGRELAVLEDGTVPAGTTEYAVPAAVVRSGVVFARAEVRGPSGVRALRARAVQIR